MFLWLIVLSFENCYFRFRKKWCLQNFYSIKKEWSSIKIFLELWHCRIIWYLFEGFKTTIVCSVHSVRFVFSTKIWFVKTSTRIVKYKSRIIRSSPDLFSFNWLLNSETLFSVSPELILKYPERFFNYQGRYHFARNRAWCKHNKNCPEAEPSPWTRSRKSYI